MKRPGRSPALARDKGGGSGLPVDRTVAHRSAGGHVAWSVEAKAARPRGIWSFKAVCAAAVATRWQQQSAGSNDEDAVGAVRSTTLLMFGPTGGCERRTGFRDSLPVTAANTRTRRELLRESPRPTQFVSAIRSIQEARPKAPGSSRAARSCVCNPVKCNRSIVYAIRSMSFVPGRASSHRTKM